MGNLFHASGTPVFDSAEHLKTKFKKTVCISNVATDYSGGWTAGSNHLQSGTTVSAIAVSGVAGKSIVLTDVLACQDAAITSTSGMSFTLAEQGQSTDIIRMSVNGGGPGLWTSAEGVKLRRGKNLVIFMGKAGGTASLTISYIMKNDR